MACALCGRNDIPLEEAHVRDKASFDKGADDRRWNLIPLCGGCHHGLFDTSRVAILRDKSGFLVLSEAGRVERRASHADIRGVSAHYIEWKNGHCELELQLALGIVQGYEHYGIR